MATPGKRKREIQDENSFLGNFFATIPESNDAKKRRLSGGRELVGNKPFERHSRFRKSLPADIIRKAKPELSLAQPKTPQSQAFKRQNSLVRLRKPLINFTGSIRTKLAAQVKRQSMRGQKDYSLPVAATSGQLGYLRFLSAAQHQQECPSTPKKDSILQQQIDHEIRMRDGTARLLAASKQPQQLVEAAKSLLTSNTRMLAYMGELQRRKASVVLQEAPSGDTGGNQLPCRGKLVVSSLRVPLMWKDSDHFKNKGDHRRYAVFCLVKVGTEVFDTQLLKCVDRTMTDLTFDDVITFEDVGADFECTMEVYSHKLLNDLSMASTPKKIRRKMGELSSSIGRSVGRRLSGLKEDCDFGAGAMIGPRFECVARTTLRARDITEHVSTHALDLRQAEDVGAGLPLFGHFCCRLAARPTCMLADTASGPLLIKDLATGEWVPRHCALRGLTLSCWERATDALILPPHSTIPVSEETQISQVDPTTAGRPHTVQLRHSAAGRATVTRQVAAQNPTEHTYWWNAFQQHMLNKVMWGEACERVMDLPAPPSRRTSSYAPTVPNVEDSDSPMSRFLNRLSVEDEEEISPPISRRQTGASARRRIDPSLPSIPDAAPTPAVALDTSRPSSGSSLGSVSSLGSADCLSVTPSSDSSSVSENSLVGRGSHEDLTAALKNIPSATVSIATGSHEDLTAALKSIPSATATIATGSSAENANTVEAIKERTPPRADSPLVPENISRKSSLDVVVAFSVNQDSEEVEMVGTSVSAFAPVTPPSVMETVVPVSNEEMDSYERDMEVLESMEGKEGWLLTLDRKHVVDDKTSESITQNDTEETATKHEPKEEACNGAIAEVETNDISSAQIPSGAEENLPRTSDEDLSTKASAEESVVVGEENQIPCEADYQVSSVAEESDVPNETIECIGTDATSHYEAPSVNMTPELPTACETTLVRVERTSTEHAPDIHDEESTPTDLLLESAKTTLASENFAVIQTDVEITPEISETGESEGSPNIQKATPCDSEATPCDSEATSCGSEATPCGSEATPCDSEVTSCDSEVTPCNSEVTPCDPEATPCDPEATPCGSVMPPEPLPMEVQTTVEEVGSSQIETNCEVTEPAQEGRPEIGECDELTVDTEVNKTDSDAEPEKIHSEVSEGDSVDTKVDCDGITHQEDVAVEDISTEQTVAEQVSGSGEELIDVVVTETVAALPATPLKLMLLAKNTLPGTPNIADMDCLIPEVEVPSDKIIPTPPSSRSPSPGAQSNSSSSSGFSMETSV